MRPAFNMGMFFAFSFLETNKSIDKSHKIAVAQILPMSDTFWLFHAAHIPYEVMPFRQSTSVCQIWATSHSKNQIN